jgi:hypothetical protein
MPAKPEWLLRLPDIRAELEHLDVPVVDRAGIERIFGLRRRRAIELTRISHRTMAKSRFSWDN